MDKSTSLLAYDERAFTELVDPKGFGPETEKLYRFLIDRVIGQERAAQRIARGFAVHNAGLSDPKLPIGAFIFAGPTGIGKTLMAEELSRFLITDGIHAPLNRIQCAKYKESHRVSELVGSPPGYVKSDEPGKLAQLKIDEFHFWAKVRPLLEKRGQDQDPKKVQQLLLRYYEQHRPYYSIILFDEVEKAHPDLWNLLLHIIDDGELQMADGSMTSFSNSVIVLTCNVGGRRQHDILSGKKTGIGFGGDPGTSGPGSDKIDQVIYDETVRLIEQHFPPELVGRLRNEIVVFRTLDRDAGSRVLDIMLGHVQKRVSGDAKSRSIPLLLLFSESFRSHLLDIGMDRTYGLRPLKKTVYKEVTLPLANAIECGDLLEGDEVMFTMHEGRPVMRRKPRPQPPQVRKNLPALMLPSGGTGPSGGATDDKE